MTCVLDRAQAKVLKVSVVSSWQAADVSVWLRGLSTLSHRGDLRSLRRWPCQKGRSKFKCDTNVRCVNDKQYMKYSQANNLINRKIAFLQL